MIRLTSTYRYHLEGLKRSTWKGACVPDTGARGRLEPWLGRFRVVSWVSDRRIGGSRAPAAASIGCLCICRRDENLAAIEVMFTRAAGFKPTTHALLRPSSQKSSTDRRVSIDKSIDFPRQRFLRPRSNFATLDTRSETSWVHVHIPCNTFMILLILYYTLYSFKPCNFLERRETVKTRVYETTERTALTVTHLNYWKLNLNMATELTNQT